MLRESGKHLRHLPQPGQVRQAGVLPEEAQKGKCHKKKVQKKCGRTCAAERMQRAVEKERKRQEKAARKAAKQAAKQG